MSPLKSAELGKIGIEIAQVFPDIDNQYQLWSAAEILISGVGAISVPEDQGSTLTYSAGLSYPSTLSLAELVPEGYDSWQELKRMQWFSRAFGGASPYMALNRASVDALDGGPDAERVAVVLGNTVETHGLSEADRSLLAALLIMPNAMRAQVKNGGIVFARDQVIGRPTFMPTESTIERVYLPLADNLDWLAEVPLDSYFAEKMPEKRPFPVLFLQQHRPA